MSWRYIDPLLEKAARHSTIFGKYWATIIVIFRLTMLQFADRAWSDEQKEFRCNTKEPGCENVCFNQFAPISNVRLWGLQLLGCAIPACLYLVYVLHLVSRAQADEREKKRIVSQIKQNMDMQSKQANNNHIDNNADGANPEDGSVIKYVDTARPTIMKEGLSLRKIQKYQKRQRKYSVFNKMILPAEYRSEAQSRSSTERKIWRFYIFQIIFRTCVDFGFLSVQYNVYPYKFVVPEVYVCEQKPCPWKVDCFVSRPTEKTIFFNYKYIIALVTCLINFLELWFIGWCRIRRAFKEDGPPPYVDIFNTPAPFDSQSKSGTANGAEQQTEKSMGSAESSGTGSGPISDHLSDRYDLPPSSGKPVSLKSDAKRGSIRSSREKFSHMDTITASSELNSSDGQSSESTKSESSRSPNRQPRPNLPRRGARQPPVQSQNPPKINQNQSNVHNYLDSKPFSPGSVDEPYLQ